MARCWGFNLKNLNRCRREGPWILYCQEHRRQWVSLVVLLVFTIGGGAASIIALLRGPPSDEDALRAELLINLNILVEKFRVGDKTYEWMVQREQLFEKSHPTLIPPNPYRDLGERLTRDLPKFKASYSAALIAERWGKKKPYDLYTKAYQALEEAEAYEMRNIRYLHTSWQRWEDIGMLPVGKMRIYGIVLTNVLKQYLLCYLEVTIHLKEIGATSLPELPKGLFFIEEIKREKNAGSETKQ